jgi:hypothetical protein
MKLGKGLNAMMQTTGIIATPPAAYPQPGLRPIRATPRLLQCMSWRVCDKFRPADGLGRSERSNRTTFGTVGQFEFRLTIVKQFGLVTASRRRLISNCRRSQTD